jgi:hypothetical protein
MVSWKRGPNVLAQLKSDVAEEIVKFPTGVVRDHIFRRFGVRDVNDESSRHRVWLLVAALVGLQKDGDVYQDVFQGERFYYPRRSA